MASTIFNIFKNILVDGDDLSTNQTHTLIQHHWMNIGVKLDFWHSKNKQIIL